MNPRLDEIAPATGDGVLEVGGVLSTVCERKRDKRKRFKDCCLKAKARIWPGLSYVCHVRSTAVQ